MPPTDDLPEAVRRARWEVGDRIRRLRREAGLTQEQLAEALVVERRTVVRLERGIHTLTLDRAVHVAAALNVELWRLFRDDDYAAGGGSGTD